jgi:hypothetical protein
LKTQTAKQPKRSKTSETASSLAVLTLFALMSCKARSFSTPLANRELTKQCVVQTNPEEQYRRVYWLKEESPNQPLLCSSLAQESSTNTYAHAHLVCLQEESCIPWEEFKVEFVESAKRERKNPEEREGYRAALSVVKNLRGIVQELQIDIQKLVSASRPDDVPLLSYLNEMLYFKKDELEQKEQEASRFKSDILAHRRILSEPEKLLSNLQQAFSANSIVDLGASDRINSRQPLLSAVSRVLQTSFQNSLKKKDRFGDEELRNAPWHAYLSTYPNTIDFEQLAKTLNYKSKNSDNALVVSSKLTGTSASPEVFSLVGRSWQGVSTESLSELDKQYAKTKVLAKSEALSGAAVCIFRPVQMDLDPDKSNTNPKLKADTANDHFFGSYTVADIIGDSTLLITNKQGSEIVVECGFVNNTKTIANPKDKTALEIAELYLTQTTQRDSRKIEFTLGHLFALGIKVEFQR